MLGAAALAEIAFTLRSGRAVASKGDIATAAERLGLSGASAIPVGDDCAAIPNGDGYLLLAIEGFISAFVAQDPWFAGWCGVMVNVSDIAAMGGRPIAVVDAVWADGAEGADPILDGLRDASAAFGVPIVGGHTNVRAESTQLSVAILGRAQRLLTSFDARPGDRLVAAIDLRGRYRDPFPNWEAATDAPAARLRGDIDLLPLIAEAGLSCAAKDISQAGIIGTAMMLAECSAVGMSIDLGAVPRPPGVPLDRWLQSFPELRLSPGRASAEGGGCDRAFRGARHRRRRYRRHHGGHRRRHHRWRGARDGLGFRPTAPDRLRAVRALRIAILAHSTNPRGGVVHALELGDALARRGHRAIVHAPDVSGEGFFRDTICETVRVPASPAGRETRRMVEVRVADYLRYFDSQDTADVDVWHAQDGISANALAALKRSGRIARFARTVHHVDDFGDPRLAAMQRTAITAADELFVVSPLWRDWLAETLDRRATVVGNGVDLERFVTPPDATDAALRAQLGLREGAPMFLSVGGVEARKNTIRILEAFATARKSWPGARLVIAGGASLLDHGGYQTAFARALGASGLPDDAVTVMGPVPQRLMPALYRAAAMLLFPSVKEGFGLAVLEAMANGVPVLTSRIQPFTDYLAEDDVIWCDPLDTASIAAGIAAGMRPAARALLGPRGRACAAAHGWGRGRRKAPRCLHNDAGAGRCLK